MTKNYILLMIFLSIISLNAFAKLDGLEMPKDSKLTIKEGTAMPNLEFNGTLKIRVKYQIDCHHRCPTIVIYPSDHSIDQIPYLIKQGIANKAKKIWIRNDLQASLKIVGREKLGELLNGKTKEISGEAVISIDDFAISYECDKPSYGGTFLAFDKNIKSPAYKSLNLQKKYGCK